MSEAALQHAYEVGRAAWPSLSLPEPALRAFLTGRVDPANLTREALDKLVLPDMYLACACIHRVDGALPAFESLCMPSIEAALARMDATGVADEVKQIVMDLLFVGKDGEGAIVTYSGRGNLRGWIRIIAVREAVRLLRKSNNKVSVGDDAMFDVLAPTEREDPELEYLKRHYREPFRQAFRRAFAGLPRRERTALRMSVLDGLSIDEIGTTFRVHRATAARWINHARELLVEGTKTELAEALKISASEVESVIRLVQSSLDVTLDSVFATRR